MSRNRLKAKRISITTGLGYFLYDCGRFFFFYWMIVVDSWKGNKWTEKTLLHKSSICLLNHHYLNWRTIHLIQSIYKKIDPLSSSAPNHSIKVEKQENQRWKSPSFFCWTKIKQQECVCSLRCSGTHFTKETDKIKIRVATKRHWRNAKTKM